MQGFVFSAITQAVFSATLTGTTLGGEQYATLPIALLPVGTALGVLPVVSLMGRYGRRRVIGMAITTIVVCNLLAGYSIRSQHFLAFCSAFLIMGMAIGAVSQLRFAAMEKVPEQHQAGAAGCVLLGGILAAFLGPEIGLLTQHLTLNPFEGSHYAISLLVCVSFLFLGALPNAKPETTEHAKTPYKTLLTRFPFLVAMSCAATSYALMSYIMTATPISMHHHYHHDLQHTKWVIQSHVIAMFLPSLLTHWIVKRIGLMGMIATGIGLFAVCILVGFSNQAVSGFWITLVLLGIAWNFMYVGATALLPQTHSPEEKYRAQGLNDFLVFGLQASASLSAGVILATLNWQWLLLSTLPLAGVQALALGWYWRKKV